MSKQRVPTKKESMEWALGITISVVITVFGVQWREIISLRKNAHKMDNVCERLILEIGHEGRRVNVIFTQLEKLKDQNDKIVELIHQSNTEIELLKQAVENLSDSN